VVYQPSTPEAVVVGQMKMVVRLAAEVWVEEAMVLHRWGLVEHRHLQIAEVVEAADMGKSVDQTVAMVVRVL
jgi:hypothetical protein